ncbi:MAG: pyrroloquinoline quinone-dependent dehydrogenase, partial [Gemmatimonadota bacterium]
QPSFPAVSDSLLAAGARDAWPSHGGGLANQRFSSLDQIHRDNVASLVPVWIHSTGIEGALATTPIVVDNTLYATTARGRVLALNAATGEELWRHEPALGPVTLCCGPINRGVAVYDNMVYVASLDASLAALDARTGDLEWRARLADPADGYSAVMAPLAADGRVFIGVAGQHYGIRGFLAAIDARSGEELWRWHTIPSEEAGGWWGEWRETDPFGTPLNRDITEERADSAATAGSWEVGGGGLTTTPAYDPATGRLFVNVEGPAPVVAGSIRPGDNLYTGSMVALDAASGEKVWHTQYLPHDVWGLSGGSPPFLFDRGDERYVAFAGRTGWIYVFHAETGDPILRSDNFVPQEALFRRPPAGEGAGEEEEDQAVRAAPGINGGNAGAGVAYHPGTGVAFVGGVHQPTVYLPDPEPYSPGQLWIGGTARFPPDDEQWGTVSAVDLGTGEIRWHVRTPAPVHSDLLATAGDLVFVGQGSGSLDAFDSRTGQLLWQFHTAAGVHGGPVTYDVAGIQYVVSPAGGSFHFDTPAGDDLIAFALASQRPAVTVNDYPTPGYDRTGPADPADRRVRQVPVHTDTAAVDSPPADR